MIQTLITRDQTPERRTFRSQSGRGAPTKRSHMRRSLFAATIVGLCLGGTAAYAGTAWSIVGYFGPQLGYSYNNQNSVTANPGVAWTLHVVNSSSSSTPTGYMGVEAILYKGGLVCTSNGPIYNSSPAGYAQTVTSGNGCGNGTYSGQGYSYAWNGSSYNTYSSFSTPSQNGG